jgi:hypothetical protein
MSDIKPHLDRLNAPFPSRVRAQDGYRMPLFAGTPCHWHIVSVDDDAEIVATVAFHQADHRADGYAEYIAAVKARALDLAAVINAGLKVTR